MLSLTIPYLRDAKVVPVFPVPRFIGETFCRVSLTVGNLIGAGFVLGSAYLVRLWTEVRAYRTPGGVS